jgi:hypothetical protein
MVLGRLLGYPKDLARVAATETRYTIATLLAKATLLDARCRVTGPQFDSSLGGYQRMRRFLADPVISHSVSGSLLVSQFEIEPDGHVMRPAEMSIVVPTTEIHGFAPGQYVFPPVSGAEEGAVHSTHQWRLAMPRRFRSGDQVRSGSLTGRLNAP